MAKRVLKTTLRGAFLTAALPLAAAAGFGRWASPYTAFAHLCALAPGTLGDYLRIAFYRLTLTECCLSSRISFTISGFFTSAKATDGGWHELVAHCYSWTATPTTASVTHGSAAVVGSGTSWDCSKFPSSGMMAAMWFLSSGSRPSSNADGDPVAYTPACTDGQHLTLDRPYEGTTGTHGWVVSSPSNDTPFIGYGSYVYMQGLLAMAFDYAAKALAISDPTNSALARSYNLSSANWIKTYGYESSQKAIYYGAQYVNCQAPI
jgi:hypothetical protein